MLVENLDLVLGAGYSVSVFTRLDEAPGGIGAGTIWVKHRTGDPVVDLAPLGAQPLDRDVHPVPSLAPHGVTVQRGVPGRWFERLPHFSAEGAPSSSGAELHSEWYVAREHGQAAVRAVLAIADVVRPAMQVVELRTVAGDDLWLSPSGGAGALGLHVTWHPDRVAVDAAITVMEDALAPFAPRPHWGKLFGLDPAVVATRFDRWDDFGSLVADLDPGGTFSNDFTDRLLGG